MAKGSRPRPFSIGQEELGNRLESIFGKKPPRPQYIPPALPDDFYKKEETMTPRVEDMKKGTCGCGRSPTGDCIGWHGLTEDAFRAKLAEYNANKLTESK
jgi:hypothetical protein